LATFTSHMFVFYFAVASAITPPVALAAFAATTITHKDPMMTAFSAVKSGIVMFTIPFVFAIYPELLLIDAAITDPASGEYLKGYSGTIDWSWLCFLMVRLALALYLVSSALAAFDIKALSPIEIFLRISVAILILSKPVEVYIAAIIFGALIIGAHSMRNRNN
jgi:TRAP-type uncharacterized transport system fused permease subunit